MALRARLIPLVLLAMLLGSVAEGRSEEAGSTDAGADLSPPSAIGLTAGSPQALALTYEKGLDRPVRLQLHAFTVLVFTSVGGRLVVPVGEWVLRPYAFAGLGLTHQAVGEHDSPAGGRGFAWAGVGLRWWMGRGLGFVEVGRASATPFGEDDPAPTAAVGLLWGWGD